MSSLVIRGLWSGYGPIPILQGIDLEVRKGEILGIIGPNGSGKSTLLKSITGIARIFKGSIKFNDVELVGKTPEEITKHGIAYAPQTDNIFPNLTVHENLELGGYLIKDKLELNQRLEMIYSIFREITPFKSKKANLLSGGERQMVALSRALMIKPQLLLLDEPTANLSPKIAKTLMDRILEIKRFGIPIILVEQNVKFALDIVDRVCVFVSGMKNFEGTPEELLALDMQQVFLGLRKQQ